MNQVYPLFCALLLACPALHAVEQKELPTEMELMKLIVIHDIATIKALSARAQDPEWRKKRVGETYILEQIAKLEQSELSPSMKAFLATYKAMLAPGAKADFNDLEDEYYIYMSIIYSAYDSVAFKFDNLVHMYSSDDEKVKPALKRVLAACEKELELLNDPVVQDFVLLIMKAKEKALSSEEEFAAHLRPHLASLPAPLAQGFKQYLNRPAEGLSLLDRPKEKREKIDDNELIAIILTKDALSAAIMIHKEKTRKE